MPKSSKKIPSKSSRLPDLAKYLTKKRLITIGIASSLILNIFFIGLIATAVTQSLRGNITTLSSGNLWQFTCHMYLNKNAEKINSEAGTAQVVNGVSFTPVYLAPEQQKVGCNNLAMAHYQYFRALLFSNNSQAIDYYVKTTHLGNGNNISLQNATNLNIPILYDAVSKQPLNIEDTTVVY